MTGEAGFYACLRRPWAATVATGATTEVADAQVNDPVDVVGFVAVGGQLGARVLQQPSKDAAPRAAEWIRWVSVLGVAAAATGANERGVA